jgi:myo-inositol-1(or 4)-monophosphatase
LLRAKFADPREIRSKGFRDIVTDADFASDRMIHSRLTRAFPDYAILSEEDSQHPAQAEYVWIVDPLDGTTNYAHRLPVFSVSIALAHRGKPVLGIVYDPMRDECFFAERGRGAYLNGARLSASRISEIERAVIGFELAREPALRTHGLLKFAEIASRAVTARIGGSAALSLCYVGAGRLDAYFQLQLSAWDVAAGILIAREGGARVTHLDGKPATLAGGAYLAANRRILRRVLKELTSSE